MFLIHISFNTHRFQEWSWYAGTSIRGFDCRTTRSMRYIPRQPRGGQKAPSATTTSSSWFEGLWTHRGVLGLHEVRFFSHATHSRGRGCCSDRVLQLLALRQTFMVFPLVNVVEFFAKGNKNRKHVFIAGTSSPPRPINTMLLSF